MFNRINRLLKFNRLDLGIVQDAKGYLGLDPFDGTYAHDLTSEVRNCAVSVVVSISGLPFAINDPRLNGKHLVRSKCMRC